MTALTRRRFLLTTGVTATALGSGFLGSAPAWSSPRDRALRPDGSTLSTAAAADIGEGYRRLTAGPGWPMVVRTDLVGADATRDERREPVAAFTQFTDLHITDAQSPVRFEYLHPLLGGAFRPQETLGAVATTRLVQRVNGLSGAPVTGRPLDFMITTGDSTDNHEQVELDWYFGLLNGGRLAQNTGADDRYEGVQDSGDPLYWHPDGQVRDRFRERGFPLVPGLLDDALREFDTPGLRIPWYATFGNHDNTALGTLPSTLVPNLDEHYTGSRKIIGRDERESRRDAAALQDPQHRRDAPRVLDTRGGITRDITPDQRRAPLSTRDFLRAHTDPANTGPGPVGHGFGPDQVEEDAAYYTFRIAPGVTGIGLDSTNTAGFAEGSLGLEQFRWLERTLTAGSSRYVDELGHEQRQAATDELFVLFSHHTSSTMNALLPDSRRPGEPRKSGGALVDLLHRFPNVLAWVNGHSHRNEILAHRADEPEHGFWEINTASHVDFPQLARIIELADNGDGTLSLFTTLIEADSPYRADYADRSPAALGALYRELAFNDPHTDPAELGEAGDRNAELLIPGRLPVR
ncbi:TIGR03767 family metallophosphoesterase [Saccharopolyspora sp. HNM0983]|uniref:TIGR03767 family metallophosphoesterase n=1 Tax=Saccharopolyspora montiporae TaxID=2781240 RepID=A0A929FY01_9PSEU|nr:TIGR03767 family metallophosphoesterase [Saccharopolyspora sp. HNM0983]MBE9372965.1 TIGR03767 family metallophosphoesterase [Saccharopolyspora sp. HNM0983]